MVGISLIFYGTEQPLKFLRLPVKLVLPLNFFNPSSTIGAIGLEYKLPNLTGLIIDFLEIEFDPGTVQELPELSLVDDDVLNDL